MRNWFIQQGRFLAPEACDKELRKALLKYHPDKAPAGMSVDQCNRAVNEVTEARALLDPLFGRQ